LNKYTKKFDEPSTAPSGFFVLRRVGRRRKTPMTLYASSVRRPGHIANVHRKAGKEPKTKVPGTRMTMRSLRGPVQKVHKNKSKDPDKLKKKIQEGKEIVHDFGHS
jgi:hypothetical protein